MKSCQIPRSTGPLPPILASITSYDEVSLIRIFHSWSVGHVDNFQCLNMILAAETIPTIRTEYALFVRVGVSVLSPKRHKRGDTGRVTPVYVSMSFSTLCQNGSAMGHSHRRCKNVPISDLHFQHELLFVSPILKSLQGVQ